MRLEFTAKTKEQAYERSDGVCENPKCQMPLWPAKYEYDHEIPAALGGDNSLANCRVICSACHKAKTTQSDIPRISKAKRQRRGTIGAKTSRHIMPGSKRSRFKKKMDGTIVLRN